MGREISTLVPLGKNDGNSGNCSHMYSVIWIVMICDKTDSECFYRKNSGYIYLRETVFKADIFKHPGTSVI